MSPGVTADIAAPNASCNASMVPAAADRSSRLTFDQIISMGFKSGERPGYTRAMTEALSQVPVADLEVLAHYVANFRGQ